jgi:Phage tail sheath protein subtilisin-like domain
MCAARVSRLPGFRFETQAPPLPEVLPRMDIAVFVGFAASGPLQIPVAIESEAQFAAIFGADAPLAWDLSRGEQLYAHLGPAVRAFFRNNGKRCWVIRVARQTPSSEQDLNYARYNYFPIPALARAEFNNNSGNRTITPAFARARSEGSWSDRLQLSSALFSQPLSIESISRQGGDFVIRVRSDRSNKLGTGDLLRLDFADALFGFLAIDKVDVVNSSPPLSVPLLEARASRYVWFRPLQNINVPVLATPVTVGSFTAETSASLSAAPFTESFFGNPHNGVMRRTAQTFDGTISVELLNLPATDIPLPGSVVRIKRGNPTWWMAVDTATSRQDGTPVIVGRPFQIVNPPAPPLNLKSAERLTFELWVRKDEEYATSISDLGLEAAHARFWGKLPTDEELYRESDSVGTEPPSTILWTQIGDLFRFPLAGVPAKANTTEFYFPLSMPPLPDNYLNAMSLKGTALERDGLAEFNEELFLDRDLIRTQTLDLAGEAEYLMYLAPQPRRLNGIHGAFPLEEVTIISVPDAVHLGWSRSQREPLPQPKPSTPPVRPEWWTFLNCNPPKPPVPPLKDCDVQSPPASPMKPLHEPEWGKFLDCSITVIEPPVLTTSTQLSDDGTFTLSWSSSPPLPAVFVLEESGTPDFIDPETIYKGKESRLTLYGRKPEDYFYRVRAFVGKQSSDYSNGVGVRVGESVSWVVQSSPPQDFTAIVLLAVQRSLLRMCAARGDLVCLLSLPEIYREDDSIRHAAALKASTGALPSTSHVLPLSKGEVLNFTYGALFHPWLIEREEEQSDRFTRMPPCGAVAGLFADRALNRGAWIAPANQPMRGVVALDPSLQPSRRLELQEAHINLVRQEPRGFVVLDAETLSDDPDLIQMNVRRLLILLRRQALKLGATYVFEPNSPAFRRAVDVGFTNMLDRMFERGAFAGATPASSYQVVTDDSLNTPQSVEQGRFIVELRVAPSLPMTFLTIRLVQTSDRSLAMEVQ